MKFPKTIIQAKNQGYKVTRLVQYFIQDKDGVIYNLPYESHHELAYEWRRKPKKKKQP